MLPLRQYLAERRAEVQAQIKALKLEIAELDAVERNLSSTLEKSPVVRERGSAGSGRKTLKEMTIEVMQQWPHGMDANAIRDAILNRFGVDAPRSSLSPQLSRLGSEGLLDRDGFIWRLTQPGLIVPSAIASSDGQVIAGDVPEDGDREEEENLFSE